MRVAKAWRGPLGRVRVETDLGRVLETANAAASPRHFPSRAALRPAWSGAWVLQHSQPTTAWILRPVE
jgi:hypothetical protein